MPGSSSLHFKTPVKDQCNRQVTTWPDSSLGGCASQGGALWGDGGQGWFP